METIDSVWLLAPLCEIPAEQERSISEGKRCGVGPIPRVGANSRWRCPCLGRLPKHSFHIQYQTLVAFNIDMAFDFFSP